MKRSATNRLLCLLLLLMMIPVAACSAPVTRNLSTSEPGAGEVFTVTLSVGGMPRGGLVETLPAGYTFAGTDYPGDRVLVRGQKVAFALTDETAITYSVQAPASGSGDITGTWEDFVAESHGETLASRVAVDGIDVPGTTASTEAQEAGSVFPLLAAIAGLIFVAYRGGRR
ncbi:MAG: hypothetical protein GX216_00120 [Methanomicrobiales archaeon]|nr:hypothetical protein [Methanomicrobiales archaeon]